MDNVQNFTLIDADCIPQRDTEISELSEWFEDATSDADWIESIVVESPACSLAGEPTLLEEIYEKNKLLEKQWRESELRYQNLSIENQKLNIQLANEKHKAIKYHKKLVYIQDNYHLVSNLRQAYLNMKYNQNTERPMVEVKETSCQTWQGIICASCIETAELKRQFELAQLCSFVSNGDDTVTIKRSDLNKLQDTLIELKRQIDVREKSWSYNEAKENRYKEIISKHQKTINSLHEIIARRYSTNEVVNKEDPCQVADSNTENMLKENVFLRKIIVKLEQRLRDLEKIYKPAERRLPLLNQQEKCIVQQLIKKYAKVNSAQKENCVVCYKPSNQSNFCWNCSISNPDKKGKSVKSNSSYSEEKGSLWNNVDTNSNKIKPSCKSPLK